MEKFEIGEKVEVLYDKPLPGNDEAPPLTVGEDVKIKGICYDREGNQHLDVGIKSMLNYVRSYETKEELPEGDKIHWCHPSRFKKKSS